MKNNYMFLYLETGGGHLAPARSLRDFIHNHYPDVATADLVNGFSEAPGFVRAIVEGGYRHLQRSARWLYGLIYLLNKIPPVGRANIALAAFYARPFLEKKILSERPGKIVIFHFLLIKPVFDVLMKYALTIPVITVVTDPFTAHPVWFQRKEQHFIVFSDELRQHCLKRDIPRERVSVFPFILEEKFSRPIPEEARIIIKQALGFSPEKKLVLIMGGGDGIPKGRAILKHLVRSTPAAEIAVVCGKDQALYEELRVWKSRHPVASVTVYGYIDFVYELLNISDIVVTKCGASMFMQTLLSKKVLIVNNYLWEQEKGNVEFLKRKNIGVYERRVRKLPVWINRIIDDAGMYQTFRTNIEGVALDNGTDQVSRFIMNFQGV